MSRELANTACEDSNGRGSGGELERYGGQGGCGREDEGKSTAEGDGSGDGGGKKPVATLNGVLWKRASKVHIAQATEAESGLARDWVTRHFRLLPAEGTLLYLQKADDAASAARGIVPLACYDDVSEPPAGGVGSVTPQGLHAFQLSAGDGGPERAFVLAAATAEEKRQWMDRLRELFAARRCVGVVAVQKQE